MLAVAACAALAVAVPKTSDDQVRIGFDQVGRQLGQALQVPFGGAEVEDQVLAFGIAQVSKPVPYNHRILIAGQSKISHPVGFLCLLRARRERPRCRRATNNGDEFPPPHGADPKAKDHGRSIAGLRSGSVARIAIKSGASARRAL